VERIGFAQQYTTNWGKRKGLGESKRVFDYAFYWEAYGVGADLRVRPSPGSTGLQEKLLRRRNR
jgi:hypothetical protein